MRKAKSVRDPGTLHDLHDLPTLLLDDLNPRAPPIFRSLCVGHSGVDARERALDQIGADVLLQVVVARIKEMLRISRRRTTSAHPEATATPTLGPPCFIACAAVSIMASSSSSVSIFRSHSRHSL
jgi:hypothetical protein